MERNTRRVTCAKCKIVHEETGTAIKHGGKYYCEDCVPKTKTKTECRCHNCKAILDMEIAQPRKERGKIVYYCESCFINRNREASTHTALLEYIYEKHGYKAKGIDGAYIVGQIKILKSMYPHYKEAGMLATLKYYYDICGNDVHPNPYKLIPYVYEEAKEFYEKKRAIEKHFEEYKEQEYTENKEPVIVHSTPSQPKIRAKIIDLDSL